jgi:hypothetical protein
LPGRLEDGFIAGPSAPQLERIFPPPFRAWRILSEGYWNSCSLM